MPRTVSVAPPDPNRTDDLDGQIVDGIEALRQRIVQAIRFRIGTWDFARREGLDYDLLIGHRIPPEIAAAALNATIRKEGRDEVTGLRNVRFSLESSNRVFSYSVTVDTIYGPMQISEGGT